MAIPDEEVARVRAATDLAALIGEHTALKRVGRRLVGLCPFHGERTPSFSVNAEEGLYYCFGCQARGDAISFVRAIDGCDFVEAVERLAARAGITLHDVDDPAAAAARGYRQALHEVMAEAVAFYHERLLRHDDARRARAYLRGRGYDGTVVRRFQLGFAPNGFDELVSALPARSALLRRAGLAHENRRGRLQDTLRERIIFPIFDPAGRPIALGGRVLPVELRSSERDPGPKYRNSPESPLYEKRRTLYGLNWAKAAIARAGEVVVCEGYTDVIGFHLAGIETAVATCGTALTEEHLRLLARFAKRVVLAFDADQAGQSAAARIYEWERRHELELAVAALPPGSDPAELAQVSPSALANAVSSASPFLGFHVDRALSSADLRSPEGRVRAAETALAAVGEHPNALVRDQYLLQIADRTRQEPDQLRPLLERLRRAALERATAPHDGPGGSEPPRRRNAARARRPGTSFDDAGDGPPPLGDDGRYESDEEGEVKPAARARDGASAPAGTARTTPGGPVPAGTEGRQGNHHRPARPRSGPRPGRDALLLAIHRPDRVAHLLEEVLFTDPLQRAAFVALRDAETLHEALARAEPEAAELLGRLAAGGAADELDPEGTVIRLVREAGRSVLHGLERDARLASSREDGEMAWRQATAAHAWLRGQLAALDELGASEAGTPAALEAAMGLVAWLAQRQRQGAPPGLEA